jgi:putative ABC transport system substrate-binding protein
LVIAGDPVRTGLAASLSRPGGNVTGLTTLSTELSVKRLELLRELLPDFSRLGVLWDNNPAFALAVQDTEQAAWAMNISVHATVVRTLRELETAVITLSRLRVPALEIMPGRIFLDQRQRMADLAARQRLATIYGQREYVDAGGLMSYGSRLEDLFRRAAAYVDRILKGAKPADLPIEQPTKFELVINAKTAKALGLTIPPSLLARADQIIE